MDDDAITAARQRFHESFERYRDALERVDALVDRVREDPVTGLRTWRVYITDGDRAKVKACYDQYLREDEHAYVRLIAPAMIQAARYLRDGQDN